MKMFLVIFCLLSVSTQADQNEKKPRKEIPSKEDQQKIKEAASDVAEETKKALRKIGRKSEEEACKFATKDSKKCKQNKK
jgi:hypothetical protein